MKESVLILGSSGMLGSAVSQYFRSVQKYHVLCTTRGGSGRTTISFDAGQHPEILPRTDYVINCIGLIKQRPEAYAAALYQVNKDLPLMLADVCWKRGQRLIHVTTDCVYSGKKGQYVESDAHDAEDEYGRSKSQGEPQKALCLRTSIIGEESSRFLSLLEWVRRTKDDPIKGYVNHIWNGMTTRQLAIVMEKIISDDLWTFGVRHLHSNAVSKHDLVGMICKAYGIDKKVIPFQTPAVDRTLASEHYFNDKMDIPPIEEQVSSYVNMRMFQRI